MKDIGLIKHSIGYTIIIGINIQKEITMCNGQSRAHVVLRSLTFQGHEARSTQQMPGASCNPTNVLSFLASNYTNLVVAQSTTMCRLKGERGCIGFPIETITS